VEIGEVITARGTFNSKYFSYDLTELVENSEGTVSNAIVAMKLAENLDGVGKIKSAKLGERFPLLFDTLINDPQAIVDACGARLEDVVSIGKQLQTQRESLSRLTILKGKFWPDYLAKRIVHSDSLFKVAVSSVYAAIPLVEGLGWLTADEIGLANGVKLNDVDRVCAGIEHLYLTKVSEHGHTKADRSEFIEAVCKLLRVAKYDVIARLDLVLVPLPGGYVTSGRHRLNSQMIAGFFLKGDIYSRTLTDTGCHSTVDDVDEDEEEDIEEFF
jgi:hypothetical protein